MSIYHRKIIQITAEDSPMRSGVYRIVNTLTGKCYVGSAVRVSTRLKDHRAMLGRGTHHSRKLQASWNKHGPGAFKWMILERCLPQDCLAREQYWLDHFDAYYNGYNSRPEASSNLGAKWSVESKRKMSDSAKARFQRPDEMSKLIEHNRRISADPEVRRKAVANRKGKSHTAEAKERIAAYQRGRKKSPESVEKTAAAQRGKPRNPASIEKMRSTKTGKKLSASHREAMRAGWARKREGLR